MMSLVQDRNRDHLNSPFKERFISAIKEYNAKYTPKVFLVEGIRSIELQKQYVKTGASKTMESNHLNGNAADIGFEGKELYPTDKKVRDNLYGVMRKYGIVNGYYDLARGFDKMHLQAVEIQKPNKPNKGYDTAMLYYLNKITMSETIKKLIEAKIAINSAIRHETDDEVLRAKLNEENNNLRKEIGIV